MSDGFAPFLFNPASADELSLVRAWHRFEAGSLERAFVAVFVARYFGAVDFELYGDERYDFPRVDAESDDRFEITFYDGKHRIAFLIVLGRYARGHAYVVLDDLLNGGGAASALLDSLAECFGVDHRLVTLTITENEPGYARAEWSVNQ